MQRFFRPLPSSIGGQLRVYGDNQAERGNVAARGDLGVDAELPLSEAVTEVSQRFEKPLTPD